MLPTCFQQQTVLVRPLMSEVFLRREGTTLKIELASPARSNALSAGVVEEVLDALTGKQSAELALVVFTGQGKNFCSGFDLGDLESTTDAALVERIVRVESLLQAVFHAPFVTLALAQGSVVGAGADLVAACTLRVASPDATFRMPGLKFGVALGTRRLMHRVGAEKARELLLTTRRFDSKTAAEIGFVQRVADQFEWPAIVQEAIESSSALPRESVTVLLSIIATDTRSLDMDALIRTAGRPGLRQRILSYRNEMQAATVKRAS